METGTYISGFAHVAVIGWAIIGGSLFNAEPKPQVQVTDVSVISSAAFDAMLSKAPDAATDVNTPQTPDQTAPLPPQPTADQRPIQAKVSEPDKPSKTDQNPDLKAIIAPPRTAALTEAPETPEPPATDQVGATLIVPNAPVAKTDQSGRKQPDKLALVAPAEKPAPKVATEAAPKPPTDAETAKEVEKSTTPEGVSETPVKPSTEKAPDQASTEIITEAKEQKSTVAPVKSSRPKGRPATLKEKANAAKAIELALAQAVSEAGTGKPAEKPRVAASGPPLTGGEVEGLRLAVRDCWNVGSMSTDAMKITVVVGASIKRDGKVDATSVKMISATNGPDAAIKKAYETAQRAVIRCGGRGFVLPAEKYDHWRDVEITFNPEKMRNK